ncbi:Helicase, C-terminal, partial [Fusarium oxysporum f. sp. vasinfectum]
MTADAEDLLWGQLMFKEGNDERFVIPLAGIEDDLTQTRRGQSFIHRNGLAGKEVEMLEDLIASSRKTDLLDQTGEWKWAGIRKYLKLVKRFEEFLLLLAHITGGQPSRGEEITGLRLINGINRDRNIFIIDGEVVLVTQYHKSLAHFDSPKEANKWELYREKMAPPSDFIWHNEAAGGVPWESSQISAAMGRWTSYYIGRRIMLQDWRHIAIAISKKHARDRGAGRADFEDGEDDHDESEQYEVPDDLAASHTGQTAANYGVTIDILKRLTAESLEIFGQVSHRWHKFLGCDKSSSLLSSPSGKKVEPIPRQDREVKEGHPPRKRAKVTSLEALQAGKIGEEAVRQAAAQQSPLVAVLPTGGGKSLVFMVPAMLASAGVTIVVAPYAELKRQLVQRCVDAGLDCKPWPEARSSWPRITLVSAEAAITDDFLQWAADLSVNGRLDRVVIDECHLTFTAAETYRSKLRGLVLLRSLGCPFVFLTGTLPPLRQRDFEEAMQLQNPLYIRASSHRLNVRYAVLRAKCKALARQLDCHYYHALRDDSDSQFIAQRQEGFQAWLRGEAPYIVATAALGTGIDVAGIIHVIHLEAPFSIIDYAQEAGRAGRTGEPVTAEVIIEDKDWPDEDAAGEACLDISVREVRRLIRTRGCRRRLLGQCLDGDLRDCKDLGGDDEAKVTRCDNCHHDELAWKSELSAQGIIASHARGRQDAHALEVLESALEEVEELGKMGCRICWMFDGIEEARHMWGECQSTAGTKDLSFTSCMDFQGLIDYKKDRQARFLSCFYCHVSQELCRDGYKTKGASCWRWKHTVIPVALAATTEADLLLRIQEAAGREFKSRQDYGDWLGRKH